MSKTFKNELKIGLSNEELVKIALEKAWECSLTHRHKYDPFDYEDKDNNLLIEIKSRNIRHNQYDTALIGYNKIQFGLEEKRKNENLKVYFCWKYLDGIFYAELGKFEYEIKEYTRGQRSDRIGKDINKMTAFIKYEYLEKL